MVPRMRKNTAYFFDLLSAMTEKELKSRYKRTVFGFLWVIINPILQMLIIGFIFTFFIKQQIEHYYFFLFIGLLIWNYVSLSLSKATPSIVYERNLIKKSHFPRSVIPLSIILSLLIHFLIALALLFVPLLFIHSLTFSGILLTVPLTIWLTFTIIGISLFTSALNVFYRDINFFVQALLMLWFYATPIIYPLTFIPVHFKWIWYFNPLTSIVQLFQASLLSQPFPPLNQIGINFLLSLLLVIVGIRLFSSTSKHFDDWV